MGFHRLVVSLTLVALTLAAFEGVSRCDFVEFDDNVLVYGNPHLRAGLTGPGVYWALSAGLFSASRYVDYWAPLTLLSRLVDAELFGFNASAHHLVNLLFHTLQALLAFLVLEAMTRAFWRSAFVAALMAVHPLHVESVAWVSERKDVLSGVFWWLTLGAYVRYVDRPGRIRWLAVVGLYALGLMAKPMVMTLPFVLLLLDYWPLGRFRLDEPWRGARARALVAEKTPLFAMTALSLAATYLPLRRAGQLVSSESSPLAARVTNALDAYAAYLRQFVWPHPLAIAYPHPEDLPLAQVAAAAAVLMLAAACAVWKRRSRPYVLVGFLIFIGMLVPVIGLVQSGEHARADRYMYLPSLGLAVVVAWGAQDLLGCRRKALASLAGIAVLACSLKTHAQVEHWHDTFSLFHHAIAVTEGNYVAHTNLGAAFIARGDLAAAEKHLREALRIRPRHETAGASLGSVLARTGRFDEARLVYLETIRLSPRFPEGHFGLGVVNARLGRVAEAAACYETALRLDPGLAPAHYNWGNLLASQGRLVEAAAHYADAVRLEPGHVDARNNLGIAIGLQGRWQEAVGILGEAVSLAPEHGPVRVSLGRALLASGRPRDAERELRLALPFAPRSADARLYLGQSLIAEGRRDEARAVLKEALLLSPGDTEIQVALAGLER